MEKKKSKKLYYIFLAVAVILLAVAIVADVLVPRYYSTIVRAIGSEVRASDDYIDEALENSKQVNIQLQEEGSVLLKNDNDALPIKNTNKVNVYGVLSAHHYTSGTGSSAAANSASVDLKEGLEGAGLEVANEAVWNMLAKLNISSGSTAKMSTGMEGQYEIDVSEYTDIESFTAAYNNSPYAIVTFGTNGGEESDGARYEDGNTLQLGENEIALLDALNETGFKTIALVNSSYVMEIGPLAEKADAILWIGGTGMYGPYGIGNILTGKANPSGRLVDTWMYDERTSSTYYTTDNSNSTLTYEGKTVGHYTNYNEGIYMGYRWYETADAEGYWDDVENEFGTGYDGVVAYPFGYGLSYTTFTEEITSFNHSEGKSTFEIEVENTGDVAGKDVVELYVEKPYKNGGVEVSEVELVGFEKTEELEAGDKETLTIEVEDEDLASYDSSHKNSDGTQGCYVLLGGDYTFYVDGGESGAHCWASVDAEEETVSLDEKYYEGNDKRSSDYVAATNQLETTDNDTGLSSTDSEAGFNELSREDGFANADETIGRDACLYTYWEDLLDDDGNKVLDENGETMQVEREGVNGPVELSSTSKLYQAMSANYGNGQHTNYNADHLSEVAETDNALLDQPQKYTLADLYTTDAGGKRLFEYDDVVDNEYVNKRVLGDVDYDDPRWDYLLSQMSADELETLITQGQYGTEAIESIEKISTTEYDGPTGITNFLQATLGIEQETTGFCSEPVIASTWNKGLVEKFGEAVGTEGNAFSNSGWYAPGMNMHRSPFGGRNPDYFSEDPYITGVMGGQVAEGAMQKGLYTYAKHFAFYDIESNRGTGNSCSISEQAAREIYLKPFEIGIKSGQLTGMMSSFMYVNGIWDGANFNLTHNIVRGEWNFKGVINTDTGASNKMGTEKMLCAGTDLLLQQGMSKNANYEWVRCDNFKTTDEGICAMKTAAHHILYTQARGNMMREVAASEVDSTLIDALYYTLNIVGYVGAAAMIALFVVYLVRDLRYGKAAKSGEGGDGMPSEGDGGDAPDNGEPQPASG